MKIKQRDEQAKRDSNRQGCEMKQEEHQLQVAVARFLDVALPKSVRACHVPNGGRRDAKTGARLKREGVKPRVADFVIFMRGGTCAMIELKTDKGRLSAAQKDWQDWAGEYGLPYAVCRSLEEVIDVLKAWQVPLNIVGVA